MVFLGFLALLVLLPKAIAIFEDNDTIFRFLAFLSFSILNQSTTNDANHTAIIRTTNNTNLSFWRWNRLNLSFYTYPSTNIYYHSNNNNNKHYTTKGQRKIQEARCYMDATTRGKWLILLTHGITKDFVYLVYSKNALLGCLVSLLKSITPPSFAVLLEKI